MENKFGFLQNWVYLLKDSNRRTAGKQIAVATVHINVHH